MPHIQYVGQASVAMLLDFAAFVFEDCMHMHLWKESADFVFCLRCMDGDRVIH